MSKPKKLKSVVSRSNEIFHHLWNDSDPLSVKNEPEVTEENIVSEQENNFNYLYDQHSNEDNASLQSLVLTQPIPGILTTAVDNATSSAIQSLINEACQKAAEKVEGRNKLVLLRLTEEIQGLRKEVMELKKAVSNVSATIIPGKPFSSIDDFLLFEKMIQEDVEKFELLKADLRRLSTSNSRKFVTKSWHKIMDDKVAEQFSWRGTAEKKCVRAFTVTTAIRQTFIVENGGKEEDFVFASKSFFQYAKNRLKVKTSKTCIT